LHTHRAACRALTRLTHESRVLIHCRFGPKDR
jgi:hypothetical protein